MIRDIPFKRSDWLFPGLAVLTAIGWLLPNHYPPWNTFHTDAWMAVCLLIAAAGFLRSNPSTIQVSRPALVLLGLCAIPGVQYGLGVLPLFSSALLASLYLAGLALAFILGENWSRSSTVRPLTFVLLAAGLAAVASVGLQLYQWLGLTADFGLMDIWVMVIGEEHRPFANLGQPNQLASLLLWGLLGCLLAWHQRWMGAAVALVLAAFVLFGIALTESRTALLTLTLYVAALSLWRPAFLDWRVLRGFQALYVFYLISLFVQEPLARLLELDEPLTLFKRTQGELRLKLWTMALDASTVSPWLGSGWGRSNAALFEVFQNHPHLEATYFEQSHSLPLDIILWVGWPLGLAITALAAYWLFRLLRSIDGVEKLIAAGAIGVMTVHALLELPLHHGYFLWPLGLIAGAVNPTEFRTKHWVARRGVAAATVASVGILTSVIIVDYFKVEAAFTELRFQMAKVGRDHDTTAPETLLLTDWPRAIALTRSAPQAGMSDAEINDWKALMLYNTAPLPMRKYVGALTLNGRREEGQRWAQRICWLLQDKLCRPLADEWSAPAKSPPAQNAARR
jgi:hypothetical protein